MSGFLGLPQREARQTPQIWGRLVGSAVGAHLCNSAASAATEVFYAPRRSTIAGFAGPRICSRAACSGIAVIMYAPRG